MLSVYFEDTPKALKKVDFFFNRLFDHKYLDGEYFDYASRVIRSIDRSDLVNKNMIKSPVFGYTSIEKISTGAKTVLVSKYYDKIMCFSKMGENCLSYFFNIANEKDIVAVVDCFYIPYNYGYKGDINILTTGEVVNSGIEFAKKYFDWEDSIREEEDD